jgi:hypothetical protein
MTSLQKHAEKTRRENIEINTTSIKDKKSNITVPQYQSIAAIDLVCFLSFCRLKYPNPFQ